ncbi:MAG: hypothetical protein ACXAEU_02885 [Candidatus Hodarchaeales archaeon]
MIGDNKNKMTDRGSQVEYHPVKTAEDAGVENGNADRKKKAVKKKVVISTKGRVRIPDTIRKLLDLKRGDMVFFWFDLSSSMDGRAITVSTKRPSGSFKVYTTEMGRSRITIAESILTEHGLEFGSKICLKAEKQPNKTTAHKRLPSIVGTWNTGDQLQIKSRILPQTIEKCGSKKIRRKTFAECVSRLVKVAKMEYSNDYRHLSPEDKVKVEEFIANSIVFKLLESNSQTNGYTEKFPLDIHSTELKGLIDGIQRSLKRVDALTDAIIINFSSIPRNKEQQILVKITEGAGVCRVSEPFKSIIHSNYLRYAIQLLVDGSKDELIRCIAGKLAAAIIDNVVTSAIKILYDGNGIFIYKNMETDAKDNVNIVSKSDLSQMEFQNELKNIVKAESREGILYKSLESLMVKDEHTGLNCIRINWYDITNYPNVTDINLRIIYQPVSKLGISSRTSPKQDVLKIAVKIPFYKLDGTRYKRNFATMLGVAIRQRR